MKTRNIIILAALVLSVLLNVYLAQKPREVVRTEVRIDTVTIYDTTVIREPVYVTQTVVRYDTALMVVAVPTEPDDTMRLANQFADKRTNGSPCDYLLTYADSVPVVVPITERTYQDRRYKAVVSGYDPQLKSLDIYSEYSVVHNTIVERKPAKLSITAGIFGGFGPNGLDYGLGVMFGVPVFSWTW
ncbi:MAG: hypothetical protein IKV15_00810 [Bacteroidaceae bacterium]|nr:hypothetical protein [Bacteroidaceae bacterium]